MCDLCCLASVQPRRDIAAFQNTLRSRTPIAPSIPYFLMVTTVGTDNYYQIRLEKPGAGQNLLPATFSRTNYLRDLRGDHITEVNPPTTLSPPLSERERIIVTLFATRMGNDQIANATFLSVNTVKWHIRRIVEKLDARNRGEAVFVARSLGLIERCRPLKIL